MERERLSKAGGNKFNGIGRPSEWNPVMGERICSLLTHMPMRKVCEQIATDDSREFSPATVYRWLASYPEPASEADKAGIELRAGLDAFREQYTRALEHRADTRLDTIDWLLLRTIDRTLPAEERLDPQSARVAIDGYRLLMELESAKKYGRAVTLKGSKDAPLEHRHVTRHTLSDEELEAIARGGMKNST
jgi:hypothetical protein